MSNIINFFEQLLTLVILWKVFKFFVFGRSRHNHRILRRILFLISKSMVYIIVKLERKMDARMDGLGIKSKSNVIPFKHRK